MAEEMENARAHFSGIFRDAEAIEYAAASAVSRRAATEQMWKALDGFNKSVPLPDVCFPAPKQYGGRGIPGCASEEHKLTEYRPVMHSHVAEKNRLQFVYSEDQQPQQKPQVAGTFRPRHFPRAAEPGEGQKWHGARYETQKYSFPYGKVPLRLKAKPQDWHRHRHAQWEAAAMRHTMFDMKYRDEEGKEHYERNRELFQAKTLRAVQRRRDAKAAGTKPPCRNGYKLKHHDKKYEALKAKWEAKNPGQIWVNKR